jgi:hypothetical protein
VTPVRIAIADDHRVVARSLQSYLASFADLQRVARSCLHRSTPGRPMSSSSTC